LIKHFVRFGAVVGALVLGGSLLAACQDSGHVINLVGSDTTNNVMKDFANYYNNHVPSGEDNKVYNTPPVLTGSSTFTVNGNKTGDGPCTSGFTYDSSGNKPPNGSSSGINALLNEDQGSGCTDVARSSRGRSGTDPSTLEFYAFAKDAVTWAHWTGGNSPSNLTQDQLKGIYLCDQPGGLPRFTNWNQVGGTNHSIHRYLPQLGSGTLSFFETRILGLTSAQQGVLDDSSCATAPTRIEENTGNQVAASEQDFAILPYSFANYTAQALGTDPDVRGGSSMGSINGIAPSATTINNKTFLGIRWVYNVLKTSSPDYDAALQVVGVSTAHGNSLLCADNSAVQTIISNHGFVNNPVFSAGPGLPNSRCRKNPTPL
jgi:phosphate transport system substrate-binding protein